jgi:hypothetical protein
LATQYTLLDQSLVIWGTWDFFPSMSFIVAKETSGNDISTDMLPPIRLRLQMLRSALQETSLFRTDLMCSCKGD